MDDKTDSVPHMDKDGIMTFPDGRRFQINDMGEVVALDGKDVSITSEKDKDRDQEYANIDYLINNHPDRLKDIDAARARRSEMEQEMGIDSGKSADALRKATEKLRARMNQKTKTNTGMVDVINQQKQYD